MNATTTPTAVHITLADDDTRIARLVAVDGEFCETCSSPIVEPVAIQLAFDDDPTFVESSLVHAACFVATDDDADVLRIVKARPFVA